MKEMGSLARATTKAIIQVTMSEDEARDTIRAIFEGVEDTESAEPANRVAKALMEVLGVRVRVQERIQAKPVAGGRKGRVASSAESAASEEG